jgi:hypothetical protein
MKSKARLLISMLTLSAAAAGPAAADDAPTVEFKNSAPAAPELYEGGRGLLTIQGPAGLYINPTSGTIPAHTFDLEYCFWTANNAFFSGVQQGAMAAYGVTDWLETGAIFTTLDVHAPGHDLNSGGPFARVRLLKDEGMMPELSIGGYCHLGDKDLADYDCFLALYKRVEINPSGFFRAAGFHAGIRETWDGPGFTTSQPVGYGGIEFQMPNRIYLVGEVSTKDKNEGKATPYAFGVQWRRGIFNCSVAFENNGEFNQPSFYFGIGSQLKF